MPTHMSDLKLPTGEYYIRNGETFAGRNLTEDKSNLPKIVTCPTDFPDEPELASTWIQTLWPHSNLVKLL